MLLLVSLFVSSVLCRELLEIRAADKGISSLYFAAEVKGSPGEEIRFQVRRASDDSVLSEVTGYTNTPLYVSLPKGTNEAQIFAKYTAVVDPDTDARKPVKIYKADETGYESDFKPFIPKADMGRYLPQFQVDSTRPSVLDNFIYLINAIDLIENFNPIRLGEKRNFNQLKRSEFKRK